MSEHLAVRRGWVEGSAGRCREGFGLGGSSGGIGRKSLGDSDGAVFRVGAQLGGQQSAPFSYGRTTGRHDCGKAAGWHAVRAFCGPTPVIPARGRSCEIKR